MKYLKAGARKARHSKSYVSKQVVINNSRNKKVRMPRQSYDILGSIAIIEFEGTGKRELAFAKHLLKLHKNVETVIAKAGAVKGKYRTRKFRHVAGKRNFIALYKENGCTFRFDVRKTFFSNRLSFERSRINSLVKDGENVMVMFAGVGPFAIEIAKYHKKANVVGIELNSYACRMFKENIKLNKLGNVTVEEGDVKKLSKKYKGFADRIIMPLPWESTKYIDDALVVAKKSAVVHLYAFGPNESAYNDITKKIREHAKQKGYNVKILFKRVVRTYSSREIEAVVDYALRKS
jgi:tRNA (guanine37-N1)-methyltransferase